MTVRERRERPHKWWPHNDRETFGDACGRCGRLPVDPIHRGRHPKPRVRWTRIFRKTWKVY